MTINYLPFQRREVVVVPPMKAARVQTGGFAVTNIARMSSGSTKRAIIQDVIMYDAVNMYLADGCGFRVRFGVDGRNYMTEDLYDYRCYIDVQHPLKATWDWSCGKRTPYRLYPGQRMKVLMQRSPYWSDQFTTAPSVSVQFNCMKVAHGSPVGTKDGEPMMLYSTKFPQPAFATALGDLIDLDSPRLYCPKDSPVDIYSVTIPDSQFTRGGAGQIVYILDGNERPFWDSTTFVDMLNIMASPISFGYGGVLLDPDETLRADIENSDPNMNVNRTVTVTYRGVLEVEDGR